MCSLMPCTYVCMCRRIREGRHSGNKHLEDVRMRHITRSDTNAQGSGEGSFSEVQAITFVSQAPLFMFVGETMTVSPCYPLHTLDIRMVL